MIKLFVVGVAFGWFYFEMAFDVGIVFASA